MHNIDKGVILMNKCRISVIIPVYNAEKYISELFSSILNQSFRDFQIIIVDDGSYDNTSLIIEDYYKKYPELITYIKQENKGVSYARNHGMQYAIGEYICFVDADDILEKDYFETMYEHAEKNKADLTICGYKLMDASGNVTDSYRIPSEWDIEFKGGIHHVFQYAACAKLFKRDFLTRYNITFSVGEILEDAPFSIVTDILAENVAVADYTGYLYRVYSDSITGQLNKKNSKPKIPYKGIEKIIRIVIENECSLEKYEVFEYCVAKMLTGFITNICASADKDIRKELCEKCYQILDSHFINVGRNPYVKINKLTKLPVYHRLAVKFFTIFYKIHGLYFFSYWYSIIHRILKNDNRKISF